MSLRAEAGQVIERAKQAEHRATIDLATYARPFVTVKALADYLDVDRRTIVRMIVAGSLSATKAGRSWRIPTDDARATFHVQRQQRAV